MKDQIIQHSNSVKYLGIFLDQNLTFQDEVKSILQKMSSITSALSKIFETVLKDQIVEFLNKNNLLSYSQFGFRSHFSSADALLFATETIRKQIDEKNIVAAAFLDLSKAFDSISHCILFEKLKELNFEDKAISVIKNYHGKNSESHPGFM